MNRALVELVLRSARGRIVRSLRLVKQPKYAIGLFVGAGWIALQLWNLTRAGRDMGQAGADLQQVHALAGIGLRFALAVGLAFIVSAAWIFKRADGAVALGESEAHLLLPSPLSRRQVLQYALFKKQLQLAAGAVVFSLLLGGGTLGERLLRFPGYWLMLTVLDVHATGVGLFKVRQREIPPRSAWRRRLVVAGVLVAFWSMVGVGTVRLWPSIAAALEAASVPTPAPAGGIPGVAQGAGGPAEGAAPRAPGGGDATRAVGGGSTTPGDAPGGGDATAPGASHATAAVPNGDRPPAADERAERRAARAQRNAERRNALGAALGAIGEAFASSPLGILLAPFMVLSGGVAAEGSRRLLYFLLGLPLLLLLHEWVVRSRAAFEERTLEVARERAAVAANPTQKLLRRLSPDRRRRALFRLAPTGHPAVAIVWILMRMMFRSPWWRTAAWIGLSYVVAAATVVAFGGPKVLFIPGTAICATFALIFPLLGGGMGRIDLRAALLRLDTIRPLPIGPRAMLVASTVAPSAIALAHSLYAIGMVHALHLGMLLAGTSGAGPRGFALALDASPRFGVPAALFPLLISITALPVLAALALLSSALQNALAAAFPAWVPLDPQGSRFDAASAGARTLFFVALVLAMLVALIPSALVVLLARLVFGLAGLGETGWLFPVYGLLAALPATVVAGLFVEIGARLWDGLDASSEILDAPR